LFSILQQTQVIPVLSPTTANAINSFINMGTPISMPDFSNGSTNGHGHSQHHNVESEYHHPNGVGVMMPSIDGIECKEEPITPTQALLDGVAGNQEDDKKAPTRRGSRLPSIMRPRKPLL
jgi:hypothetical protein